jgi:hypothetical protein
MSDADLPEFDEQDQSEVFDEDVIGDEGVGPSSDMRVFEELPDVFDATSAVGDADVDGDLDAADADELDDEALDDIDLDEDDDDLEDLGDEPEDDEVFDDDEDDLDEVDGVDLVGDDEVEQTLGGDLNDEDSDEEVADYESEDELSDEDVKELGYQDDDVAAPDDVEEEEVDEREEVEPRKAAQGHSGEAADKAAEGVKSEDLDEMDRHQRQQALLDEGVEETFPASDPVSVKRIT